MQKKPDISTFLVHYGVKGMKWGVRRTPEQLGHKPPIKEVLANSLSSSTIVQDAIRSGEVSKTVNRQKQERHTASGHQPGRSYIHGDLTFAQDLIDELSGTGEPKVDRHGKWVGKEAVRASEIIGTHSDTEGNMSGSLTLTVKHSRATSRTMSTRTMTIPAWRASSLIAPRDGSKDKALSSGRKISGPSN